MKYTVDMASGCHDIRTKFHEDWFGHRRGSSVGITNGKDY
jgi:hypothetical protein